MSYATLLAALTALLVLWPVLSSRGFGAVAGNLLSLAVITAGAVAAG